jgi:hypothetical protein
VTLARVAVLGVALAAAPSCADAQGYSALFNGGLGGWVVENSDGANFAVGEDVLRVTGPEGWLRSERTYADFRLRVEFRFLTDDADSGVFVRAQNDAEFIRGWPNQSYQVQLRNPLGESRFPPVGGLFRHGMPDGPTRFDPADAARLSRPTGEWQALEIEAVGERIAVRLNGEPLMEAEGLANPEGYIGLQGELGALEIRAIAIEEL